MPTITFSQTGQTLEVEVGASFLEACKAAETPQNFGCTVGSCGTCCILIESGEENVQPRDDEERETVEMCSDEEDARLGCQMTVNGDISVRPAV